MQVFSQVADADHTRERGRERGSEGDRDNHKREVGREGARKRGKDPHTRERGRAYDVKDDRWITVVSAQDLLDQNTTNNVEDEDLY